MQIAKISEVNFCNCDPLTVEEKKELDALLVLPEARTFFVLNSFMSFTSTNTLMAAPASQPTFHHWSCQYPPF
jgi:hypothetical protein